MWSIYGKILNDNPNQLFMMNSKQNGFVSFICFVGAIEVLKSLRSVCWMGDKVKLHERLRPLESMAKNCKTHTHDDSFSGSICKMFAMNYLMSRT